MRSRVVEAEYKRRLRRVCEATADDRNAASVISGRLVEELILQKQGAGVKSLADDPFFGLGVVRSRAANALRSIETYPVTRGFVRS